MHDEIAQAGRASGDYWGEHADTNSGTNGSYSASGDPYLEGGGRRAGEEAARQRQVAANRYGIAAHHEQLAAE